VVWEPTTFAAPVAALEVGAPAVRYLWGPDIVGRGSSGRDRLPESVRALFGAGSGSGEVPDWWTVDPCPPSVQLAGERWLSVQYVPYSSQSRVPVSLLPSPGRRRVLVTLGLSVTELVGESAFLPPLVLDALAGYGDLDVLVAVQPGQQELLGTLPGNARAVAGCPLHLLMPSCALVVHHGGAGSLLTAARYGVPQLMLTQMPDRGFYAGRLAATGAGVHLRGADADAHSVRAAVADLLGRPEYPAAAVRLRAEALAQPTPADLVHRLLLEGVRS